MTTAFSTANILLINAIIILVLSIFDDNSAICRVFM